MAHDALSTREHFPFHGLGCFYTGPQKCKRNSVSHLLISATLFYGDCNIICVVYSLFSHGLDITSAKQQLLKIKIAKCNFDRRSPRKPFLPLAVSGVSLPLVRSYHGGTSRRTYPSRTVIHLSTPHEMPSQLGMKMRQVRGGTESATLWAAGEVRLHLGGRITPFVQRGRIAQENSSM